MARIEGAIAATRFGMGARPGEIDEASRDPRGWLKAQIKAGAAMVAAGDLKSTEDVIRERREEYGGGQGAMKAEDMKAGDMKPRDMKAGDLTDEQKRAARQMVQKEAREGMQREIDARGRQAVATTAPFAERWARFWANHFTVAARNAQLIGLVGPYEREAIRPHVFGNFSDLLGHAALHPGMLVYLDNFRSIGPSTQAAERRKAGLNENLAREVLELHTVGVRGGYAQDDVIEFAKALTGWTVGGMGGGGQMAKAALKMQGAGPGAGKGKGKQKLAEAREQMEDATGQAVFLDTLHEPGARTVLGKTYAEGGAKQATAILNDLSRHPATAKHVAMKLAKHFVADEPPASAVNKLEIAFNKAGGNLTELAHEVVNLDEAWNPANRKFKTPEELLVSTGRAAGREGAFGRDQRTVYQSLAQQPFSAPSPAGWPDDTASWAGPDAIKKRLEWANAVARRLNVKGTPSDFLDQALGPLASEATRKAVARAESAEQGFTLALMSPEFQRR